MAKLTGQTIADSYDQLLIVDDANGITSSLQAVESADTGGSSSALSISTVAISVAGNATITTADNSDTLTLISTDADADSGPNLRMYRNSGSPAQNDIAGQIEFQGRNNNSQDVAYGQINSKIETVTDGSEDGDMKFSTMKGGTLRDRLNIHTTATVFNEDHEDVDFRVESDTITHALFVQGSDGNVGIGVTPDTKLHILDSTNYSTLKLEGTGTSLPGIKFENVTTGLLTQIYATNTADMAFVTGIGGAVESMRMLANGNVGIGETGPATRLDVVESINNTNSATIPWATFDNDSMLIKNSNTSDANNYTSLAFYNGGSGGNFSSRILNFNQANGDGSMSFHLRGSDDTSNTTERMRISSTNDVTVSAGNLVIGTAGKGIDFSAQTPSSATGATTGDEVLDHYEEGTWTAVFTGTTSSAETNTTGYYTKIGRMVYFSYFSAGVTLTGSSGTAGVSGLPFTASSLGYYYGQHYKHYGNCVDGSSSGGYVASNTTVLYFIDESSSSAATYIDGSGKEMMVTGWYIV